VGSIQEEENQRGLAHFLEHMCFNGTTHFPGDALKQYLERIGVKFGENLNAYTSFDETVYNINNVNVETAGAIDSCLLILHDWSHDLLLEDKEIDKERGVINEEWRMRRSAMMRMQEAAFKDLFVGSRYADRMPICTMDIVMNFPYDDLRSYYRRWYRPDLQGLVIVGDVNPDEIEQKIKDMFADIAPAPADAAKREVIPVPDNDEAINDEVVCALVLNDHSLYHLTESMAEKYEKLYPAVDVRQEFRNMSGWCEANPMKRKTRVGVKRFVTSWLAREQNNSHLRAAQSQRTAYVPQPDDYPF
jgi:zinc protease